MLFPAWMFDPVQEANRKQIFAWWEARRSGYNVRLLALGVAAWVLVLVAGSQAVRPGEDFEEPIVMLSGPIIYVIMANICYTFGPLFGVTFYQRRPRVKLFKFGLIFSLVLTALPGIWAVTA